VANKSEPEREYLMEARRKEAKENDTGAFRLPFGRVLTETEKEAKQPMMTYVKKVAKRWPLRSKSAFTRKRSSCEKDNGRKVKQQKSWKMF
jgi:hypothetical protein